MRHRFYATCLLLVTSLFYAPSVWGTEDFKVTIHRTHSDRDCTSGYLAVNGTFIAYTLELPWNDNAKNVSSILAGTYPGFLRYDHADKWRIELQGVPSDRTWIQIHTGNEVAESKGCILVGSQLTKNGCSIAGGKSAIGYAALKKAFYGSDNPTSTPDKAITVQIIDEQPACTQAAAPKASAVLPPTRLSVAVQ